MLAEDNIFKKIKDRIMNIKEKVYGHILNAMAYAQNVSDWEDCRKKAKTISELIIKRCLHEHKYCPQCGEPVGKKHKFWCVYNEQDS